MADDVAHLLDDGSIERARELAEVRASQNPGDSTAVRQLAYCMGLNNEWDQAIELLQTCGDSEAGCDLVWAYLWLGRYGLAYRLARSLVRSGGSDRAIACLACAAPNVHRAREARAAERRLLGVKNPSIEAKVVFYNLALKGKQWERAVEILTEAGNEVGESYFARIAFLRLAQHCVDAKLPKEFYSTIRRQARTPHEESLLLWIRMCHSLEDPMASHRDAVRYSEANKTDPNAILLEFVALRMASHEKEAVEALARDVWQYPEFAAGFLKLAKILVNAKEPDLEMTVACWRAAHILQPEDRWLSYALSATHLAEGRFREFWQTIRRKA